MLDPLVKDSIADIDYLKHKLAEVSDPLAGKKLQKQITLLEDALVIYKLHQPPGVCMTNLEKLTHRLEALDAAIAVTQTAATCDRKMSDSKCKATGHVTQALSELQAAKTHVLHLLERIKIQDLS